MASETNMRLKLLVDKKSKKVLFAEAGKDFVDFLFALLEIPLGTLMGLVVEQGLSGAGSLGKVYNSVQNLEPSYLQPNQNKDSLLRPKTASSSYGHASPLLQTLVSKEQPGEMYFYYDNRAFRQTSRSISYGYSGEVGYVKGTVTYMVRDDLTVKPMSTISGITLLTTFDVKDVGNLVEKTVVVDTKKALELLKALFESNTVLTDVFVGKKMEISMADRAGESGSPSESLMEKIADKVHGHDSSSSDSDDDEASRVDSVKSKIYRLLGREEPVHKVLGGADVFLWRNKKISAGVLGGATAVCVLFELLEYHLLTLVCRIFILCLAILFLWSNVATYINKSPPHIPEVKLPENVVLELASALRIELNCALAMLRDIASGRDLKKFLAVVAALWVLSIVGSCCDFLTLFYISFVLLHTVPVLYEKYEDQVDSFAEKAEIEIKKHYAVFNQKVLSKIPRRPLKDEKKD